MPYAYSFRVEAKRFDEPARVDKAAEREFLQSLSAHLHELTGGCGVCQHSDGLYCQQQRQPVSKDDPRCDSFLRRQIRAANENSQEAQVKEYVNGILGITDRRTVSRLTGGF